MQTTRTRARARRLSLRAAAAALLGALAARPARAQDDAALLAELRRGGLVLACRHALTDTTPVRGCCDGGRGAARATTGAVRETPATEHG